MPKIKDYYEVLGIPHRAHVRVVEESYWEQAHELQKQPTRKAAKKLHALNEAYEIIGTPHKRLKFDREWSEADGNGGADARSGGFFQTFVNLLGRPFRPD